MFFEKIVSNVESYIPNDVTQHADFLKKHPKYDGRGLLIAILDDGVDISCPGMQQTSTGIPKIFDCFDFTGAGNVDTSTIKEADENNIVIGLSGRTLKIPSMWKNPSGKWHLGKKSFHELIQKCTTDKHKILRKNKSWAFDVIKLKKYEAAKNALKKEKEMDKYYNGFVNIATDMFKDHVMHISGLHAENFSIALLEDFFNIYAPVAYILYREGSTEVRLFGGLVLIPYAQLFYFLQKYLETGAKRRGGAFLFPFL